MKVIVPVAVEGVTVAVRFTGVPVTSVPVDVVVSTVVVLGVLAAVTVTVTALDVLASYVLSPLYFTVIDAVPTAVKLVVSAAVPEVSVSGPREVVPL